LADDEREKIALFTNVEKRAVIEERDKEYSIYEVPISLANNKIDQLIIEKLRVQAAALDIADWHELLRKVLNPERKVTIAVVGKYVRHKDAYKSIYEALDHGGIAHEARVVVRRVESEDIEKEGPERLLGGVDGILVPGGFGHRGTQGKIDAVRFARERGVPYFGICLGMQCAVIEFARNVLGLEAANSTEFDREARNPVICMMEEQKGLTQLGGTMRLGSYPCKLLPASRAAKIYGQAMVAERHRHRYEFNNSYRDQFTASGMIPCGLSPDESLVEMIEIPDHPWFVAVQFHPEFKSKPTAAHPLFAGFVEAALAHQKEHELGVAQEIKA
jgi:CTP synthase